jgi:hypothetical protein
VSRKHIGLYIHRCTPKCNLEEKFLVHNNEAFRECPKFDSCSANDCPLDTNPHTFTVEDDPETECTYRYAERKKIAEKYGLPNMGMTKKELVGYHRSQKKKLWWKNLSEEKKKRIKSNLR